MVSDIDWEVGQIVVGPHGVWAQMVGPTWCLTPIRRCRCWEVLDTAHSGSFVAGAPMDLVAEFVANGVEGLFEVGVVFALLAE